MSMLSAIFLGLVQGLAEFLPVSSSGHLAIFKYVFHANTDTGLLFDTLLHLGTLIAVCIVYRKDIINLITAFFGMISDIIKNIRIFIYNKKNHQNKKYRRLINSAYKKLIVLILVTTIPTGIIGVLLSDVIEKASETLLVPGICLVVTAIILLLSDIKEPGDKKVKKTTYMDAGIVGIAQGFATLPGISRSGTTITACLFLGFDRAFAVKYSFIASIPAIVGANILELRHADFSSVTSSMIGTYVAGMIVAGVVGFICINLMIRLVKNQKFQYFAYYCAIVGILSIIAYFVIG